MATVLASYPFKFIALRALSTSKYLSYVNDDAEPSSLRFSGEKVTSPSSKFEVELAKSNENLVHIRSCYNNKYLVAESSSSNRIVAAAKEPEEDETKWNCTLFKPILLDNEGLMGQFVHVQSNQFVRLGGLSEGNSYLLKQGETSDYSTDSFFITKLLTSVVLPRYVTFLGNNKAYLQAIDKNNYLQFGADDIGEARVMHEVFPNNDGSVRIKSLYFDRFWRRDPNWIKADSTDTTTNDSNTLFVPTVAEGDMIALKNLGNYNFCKRLTLDGKTSCLNAATSTITNEAMVTVQELVFNREIYDVKFRLSDSRIYDQQVLVLRQDVVTNLSNRPSEKTISLPYKNSSTRTWNSGYGLTMGVAFNVTWGVPLVNENSITVSTEISTEYNWGRTEETTFELESSYAITINPQTRVTVKLLATKGACDVPFSYCVRDVLTDGSVITYKSNDGVFTGVNNYNFHFQIDEEKL